MMNISNIRFISAVYGTEEYPVTYSFYLGDNLENDHNIEANRLLDEKTGKVRMDANKNIGTESWGFVWSEDSYNFGKGYAHAPQPDNLVKSTSHRKSRGLPVRCITDMNWINKQNQ